MGSSEMGADCARRLEHSLALLFNYIFSVNYYQDGSLSLDGLTDVF